MGNNSSTSGGIGVVGALTILFIGLKLVDKIDWPWLWVLSPLWIVPAALLIFLAVVGALFAISEVNRKVARHLARRQWRKKKTPGLEDVDRCWNCDWTVPPERQFSAIQFSYKCPQCGCTDWRRKREKGIKRT